MFLIRYGKSNTRHAVLIINKIIIFFMRSLQAQVEAWLQKRKGALRFVSCEGTATVETALALPLFLCAAVGLLMLGNLLLTEAKIQYALSRTADMYAVKMALDNVASNQNDDLTDARTKKTRMQDTAEDAADMLLTNAGLHMIFTSVYEDTLSDDTSIYGGRAGIILSASLLGEEETAVRVRASYRLKIEIPFLGEYAFPGKAEAVQRVFSGYVEHGGEAGGNNGGDVVYVTEHGSVYHTSLSCSHICLRIDGDSVKKILQEDKYQACDKCMDNGKIPSVLYVTRYGDKYHSSLGCSGLKRTVKAIPRDEAEGMRMCSRCAAGQK